MTPQMRAVLLETMRRTDALKVAIPPKKYLRWEYARWEDATTYGPEWHPGEWFAGPEGLTGAERMRYLRAARDLEDAGLVEISRVEGTRQANVKLTPEGELLARRLAGQQAPE
jgi:hypothetical protein